MNQLSVFLWAIICVFLPTFANAQTTADGLLPSEVPQAISPTAMEMGRYGKHPVSFFTGTPQISIPLTELRAKGRTLPIYLSYHSGGTGIQRFLCVGDTVFGLVLPVGMLVGSAVLPPETRLVVRRRKGVGQRIVYVNLELVAPVGRIAV